MDQRTLAGYVLMVAQELTAQHRGSTADRAGQPAALETVGLRKSFGALRVADGIDFRLPQGARHALIGPNGAGKTTLINLLTGALPPSAGRIRLCGTDVTHLPQHARVRLGLARTFQINQLFGALPVIDHVALATAERTARAGISGARSGARTRSWTRFSRSSTRSAWRRSRCSRPAPCPMGTSASSRSRLPWRGDRASCC